MTEEQATDHSGLVASGKRELASRSSAVVRRGLDLLAVLQQRAIRFPADHSVGELFVRDRGVRAKNDYCDWEWLCEARGAVSVPASKEVELRVSDQAATDLSPLTALASDDLRSLSLMGAGATDADLRFLSRLTGLRELYLSGNDITDAGLAYLQGLTVLEALDLTSLDVTDAGLKYLAGMMALRELGLGSTRVTDSGLAQVRGLTALELLDLNSTRVGDAGLIHLQGLTALETLVTSHTLITDAGLVHLRGLTSLKSLDLDYTQATPAGLACLAGLTELHAICWREDLDIGGELELGRVIHPCGDFGRQLHLR